jgi:hypothetical protein
VRRLAVALLLATTACSSGQDPGLSPGTGQGPTTTSHTLQRCPPGGPDATTPAAGCLDADGTVVRP